MVQPTQLYRHSLKFFTREVFRQLHRNEPPLQLTWYMQAMCHALEDTFRGDCRRLVINVPPRHGKSITAAVAFNAWLLGLDPTLKIMVGTYNEDLARHHDRQLRQIMESPEYRAAFPNTVINRKATRQLELHTTAGGFRMAVTTGGTATGFGGDYIILDDCMKAQDASSEAERNRVRDWYRGTIGTRLNNKSEGIIISIQQRLHEDDLTSYILEAGATHLCLPSIAQKNEVIPIGLGRLHERKVGDLLCPEREDEATLDRLRRELGPRVFVPQYLQDPVPEAGNIVQVSWFPRYEVAPERHLLAKIVQSWDTAWLDDPSAAYSVCTTWGCLDGRWFLLDVLRRRIAFHDLKPTIILMKRQWQADRVLIEDAASGQALWPLFRAEGPFLPTMWPVKEWKGERLIAQTGQMEAGKVVLPEDAPWLDDYLHELKAAPNCKFWDQVDSTTQFLEFALSKRGWIDQNVDPKTGRPIKIMRKSRLNRG